MTIMDKQAFLARAGVHGQALEIWIEQQWLLPQRTETGWYFAEIDVARARLIDELGSALGVNDQGIDVILHLMDQLHGLRQALAELRQDMPGGPD